MMKFVLIFSLTFQICLLPGIVKSQTADALIDDLEGIHNNIKAGACSEQQIVSNRAMNIFLSDRIGSYLGSYNDLSLYKNSITFNSVDGTFSLNHNFFQANGKDEPVKSFLVVGVKTNAANAFAAAFANRTFTNELGVTIKKSWIHKPAIRVNNCAEKYQADATRAADLTILSAELQQREQAYWKSLSTLEQGAMPDSIFAQTKQALLSSFHQQLAEEFNWKFHYQQYQYLVATERFKQIKTHWTNVSAYLPVITQRFLVAPDLSKAIAARNTYPFELSVTHTRFWESTTRGRLFITLELSAFLNNSARSKLLDELSTAQYESSGGTDTATLRRRKISNVFVGKFNSLISPSAKLNLVYFPHESHIGISASVEQFAGQYNPLNWTVGIPVVLIDKVKAPAATFEFQVRFFDMTHKVFPSLKIGDNIMVGMTLGVPFSKIVY